MTDEDSLDVIALTGSSDTASTTTEPPTAAVTAAATAVIGTANGSDIAPAPTQALPALLEFDRTRKTSGQDSIILRGHCRPRRVPIGRRNLFDLPCSTAPSRR